MRIATHKAIAALLLATGVGTAVRAGEPSVEAWLAGGPLVYDVFTQANALAITGGLSTALDITPNIGVQGDVVLRHETVDRWGGDSFNSGDLALHLYYSDPESFLVGVFGQVGRDASSFNYIWDRVHLGVEAQLYLGDLTLYGQAGRIRLQRTVDTAPYLGWFASGEIAYYITPDFKVEAHGGVIRTEWFGYNSDAANIGLGAEYKFEDMPFSIFGSYDYFRSDFTTDNGMYMQQQRVQFGVKFNLDDGTLKDNDRNGVRLAPVRHSQAFGPMV